MVRKNSDKYEKIEKQEKVKRCPKLVQSKLIYKPIKMSPLLLPLPSDICRTRPSHEKLHSDSLAFSFSQETQLASIHSNISLFHKQNLLTGNSLDFQSSTA